MAVRIGGDFSFGQGMPASWSNSVGAVVLQLAPGQSIFPPAGKYEFTSSLVSLIQNWDPQEQSWRSYGGLGPTADAQDFETDGYNWRIFNSSGVVVGAQITAAGSGATNGIGSTATGATVSLGAAPANGIAAVMYPVVGGMIGSSATITNAGAGLVAPPLLVCDPPPVGGVTATMYVSQLSSGTIGAVTVLNQGAGYTSIPNVKVIPQFGGYMGQYVPPDQSIALPVQGPTSLSQSIGNVGAFTTMPIITAQAITGSGTLTALGIQNNGWLYTGTSVPTITLGGLLGGSPAATALMSLSAISASGGTLPGAATNYIWSTDGGLIVTKYNNHYLNSRPAKFLVTSGPTYVLQDPGFGLQKVPAGGGWTGAQYTTATGAAPTVVCGGITDAVYLAFV